MGGQIHLPRACLHCRLSDRFRGSNLPESKVSLAMLPIVPRPTTEILRLSRSK